jgi:hypothetical protein
LRFAVWNRRCSLRNQSYLRTNHFDQRVRFRDQLFGLSSESSCRGRDGSTKAACPPLAAPPLRMLILRDFTRHALGGWSLCARYCLNDLA